MQGPRKYADYLVRAGVVRGRSATGPPALVAPCEVRYVLTKKGSQHVFS